MTTDIKGFRAIVTDVKTVIGLVTVVIALITFVVIQQDKIGDMEISIKNYELVNAQKFEKIEALLESIDRSVGFNRNYIMNQLTPKLIRAVEIK